MRSEDSFVEHELLPTMVDKAIYESENHWEVSISVLDATSNKEQKASGFCCISVKVPHMLTVIRMDFII